MARKSSLFKPYISWGNSGPRVGIGMKVAKGMPKVNVGVGKKGVYAGSRPIKGGPYISKRVHDFHQNAYGDRGDGYPENWDDIRKQIYKRDNYTCQDCGARGGNYGNAELHAHHMVPISQGGSHDSHNLETLCRNCHANQHSHMKRQRSLENIVTESYQEYYPENKTYERQGELIEAYSPEKLNYFKSEAVLNQLREEGATKSDIKHWIKCADLMLSKSSRAKESESYWLRHAEQVALGTPMSSDLNRFRSYLVSAKNADGDINWLILSNSDATKAFNIPYETKIIKKFSIDTLNREKISDAYPAQYFEIRRGLLFSSVYKFTPELKKTKSLTDYIARELEFTITDETKLSYGFIKDDEVLNNVHRNHVKAWSDATKLSYSAFFGENRSESKAWF